MEFDMAFQLKGNRKETENKTIRFPIHLIDQIEQAISDSDQDITCLLYTSPSPRDCS